MSLQDYATLQSLKRGNRRHKSSSKQGK